MNAGMKVCGYVRVSHAEQAQSGAGLEAQRDAIEAAAQQRGWELTAIYEDAGVSGSSTNGRPGLAQALKAVESDEAAALICAKLDRLSRSIVDFGRILERSRKRGWAFLALDLGVDTSTAAGELVANVLASVAQWERRAISERTKAALAVKKREGVKLGNPQLGKASPRVRRRIQRARSRGDSYHVIAAKLNADEVPTSQGGSQWWAASVRAVVMAA